jgi:cytochrome d ubiquinol oxidase subunit II
MSAELLAAVMLLALMAYAVLAGADFGGGVWDLVARGSRARRQRRLIESALAPVWEANHVWLIFAIVVLFTAFPLAYARLSIALHVPLTLMLLGVVLRGSAFVFRQYGGDSEDLAERRWGRLFAIASTITPLMLGAALGAVASGSLVFDGDVPRAGFFRSWLSLFPALVGLLALASCAFLAAVYLVLETNEPDLQNDFRVRSLGSGVAVLLLAGAAALTLPAASPLSQRLFASWWSAPLLFATALASAVALLASYRRHYRIARASAVVLVLGLLAGFGAGQYPYLIPPQITLHQAAAPAATLRVLGPTLAVGALILLPSLYYLLRVFKLRTSRD